MSKTGRSIESRGDLHVIPADVFINGRFLTQPFGGVQRFSSELVKALDRQLARDAAIRSAFGRWRLLVPRGCSTPLDLEHIETEYRPAFKSHLWDQMIRFFVPRDAVLLNLANAGPVLCRRSIVVIHDAAVYRTPLNFTFAYRTFHKTLGYLIAARSRIGTVSQFSRTELGSALGLAAEDIFIVANGCEHMLRIADDPGVLSELGIDRGRYFLCVASPSPNKDLATAIKAYAALGRDDYKLVIVGATDSSVFGKTIEKPVEGTIFTGKIPDVQIVSLMKNAAALVFPSVYEGFGIPPLEAMVLECPTIASKIPPVEEVCGDAVVYFKAGDPPDLAEKMLEIIDEPNLRVTMIRKGALRSAHFSWEKAADLLIRKLVAFRKAHRGSTTG